jgi:hypothetical protein
MGQPMSLYEILDAALVELGSDKPAVIARFRTALIKFLPEAIEAAVAEVTSDKNGGGETKTRITNMNDFIRDQTGRTVSSQEITESAVVTPGEAGAGTGTQPLAKPDMNQFIRTQAGKRP